jgi:C_GCAxxG_C_C family probable redox protein
MSAMNRVSDAVGLFDKGCACSQAILAVYGEHFGLERGLAMRIASGFAGGMRMAETCGAVTGAFMVLGLRHGTEACVAQRGRGAVYAAVQDFTTRFQARNGTVVCRDLLGCDVATPEGLEAAKKQGLFKTKCLKMVRDAAEILETML